MTVLIKESFMNVYTKFKINFYREIFTKFQSKEVGLTPMETLAVEMIYILGEPTVNEFTQFAKLSSPNAAYKIAKLVKKGYIEKIQSKTDKREYYLRVTEEYKKHYNFGYAYVGTVINRVEQNFTQQELEIFNKLLVALGHELMHEVPSFKKIEE